MSVQPIGRHYSAGLCVDEAKSKISEAITRARRLVEVGSSPIETDISKSTSSDSAADVKVITVTEYSDVNDTLCGCLTGATEEPIVVYLVEYDEVTELLALRAGAADVLRPDMTVRVMAERITRAGSRHAKMGGNGEHNSTPFSYHGSPLKLDDAKRTVELCGLRVQLTKTELSVLKLLHENCSRLVSREELIQAVGTNSSHSDIRAVDSHIKRLRQKFADAGFPRDMIKTVYGTGYRLDTEG